MGIFFVYIYFEIKISHKNACNEETKINQHFKYITGTYILYRLIKENYSVENNTKKQHIV